MALVGRYLAHSAVVAVAAGMKASGARRADEIGVEEEDVEVEGALRAVGGRDPDPEEDEAKGDGAGVKALDEVDDDGAEASPAKVAADSSS